MKIPVHLALAVAALFLPALARAESLDDAHRAFAEGRYHASTLGYQSVLAQNGYSAPVLFDLGNSYYREGNLAQAILAYKRAQWLAPADTDIGANLRLAEEKAGVAAAEPSWTEWPRRFLSVSEWARVASGAWTLLCASLFMRTLVPRWRFLFSSSSVACVLALFTAIAAITVSSGELHQAVVIDKNASALISPFVAAQAAFSPLPGETVTVQKAYDDFLLVRDPAGHSGWIGKTQISPIIPTRPVSS
jgi:tetratricopeptide (TPR) repeat protein